jgi:hypothetical protein
MGAPGVNGIGTLLTGNTLLPITLTCGNQGNPLTGVLLGAGEYQDAVPLVYPSLDFTFAGGFKNCAWLIPRSVAVSDLAFYFVTDREIDLGDQRVVLYATIWISQKPNDLFVPIPDTTVFTAPLIGHLPVGSNLAASLCYNKPIKIRHPARILCIVGMSCETHSEQTLTGLLNVGILLN